mmetsp:Transcript_36587/g.53736  ORF Transcript_36587/g.53736 Transcript_36587/m.53736 type:complete len:311 (-) Transcript_36587:357-1289(-)
MNANTMLLAYFSALPGNTDSIVVRKPHVKDRFEILSVLGIALLVERKGSLVSLGERDNVIDATVRGGETASSLSYVGRTVEVIGFDLNRISGSIDSANGILVVDVDRRDKGSHLVPLQLLGHTHELNGSPEHLGVLKVDLGQLGDAPAANHLLVDVDTVRQSHENLQLGPGVKATHVQCGISLGVSQHPSLCQGIIVTLTLGVHRREHKIGASVDNSAEHLYVIPHQITLHRSNHGNATAHGCLVSELGVLPLAFVHFVQQTLNFGELIGNQSLVGGYHVLLILNGAVHHILRVGRAAHHFYHHINTVVV